MVSGVEAAATFEQLCLAAAMVQEACAAAFRQLPSANLQTCANSQMQPY